MRLRRNGCGLTGDRGVVAKARIKQRVADLENFIGLQNRVGAEGVFHWRLAARHAKAGFEPLTVAVDHGNQCDRRVAKACRKCHDVVVGLLRQRVQDLQLAQRAEPSLLVDVLSGSLHGHLGSRKS